MPSIYSQLAGDWHLLHPPRLAAVDFLVRSAGDPPGRVVDVAAGSGEYAALLQRRGYEAFAVDVNREICEAARERHPQLAGIVHGDMLEIFDLVRGPLSLAFCIGGALCELSSVREVADVIAQMLDLAVPAGCAVIEMPNFEHLRAQAVRLQGEIGEAASDVRYGDLEDAGSPEGSPQLGSVSSAETRLYLPPVSAFREDGSELRLEQQYVWSPDSKGPTLRWQFSAPEGDSAGELQLLELTRPVLETAIPTGTEVEWYSGWDSAPWSSDSALTIAVLRRAQ